MKLSVRNETSKLEAVVLGIGTDRGTPRPINPMIRKHLAENTYPTEANILREIKTFETVLEENDVEVLRPTNLKNSEQIFTRDIGFVIEDNFFISRMKHEARAAEIEGIQYILDQIDNDKKITVPKDALIEGGDIIVWNDYIFAGISDRTNQRGVDFLEAFFPNKEVFGLAINEDQDNPDINILHLDCTFQPIGTEEAIIYEDGFVDIPSVIYDMFSNDQLIKVNLDQKNRMFPNVFSIDVDKIVIERGFVELKEQLVDRGYTVFEVDYQETSKLSGLLRCSTLPLRRK